MSSTEKPDKYSGNYSGAAGGGLKAEHLGPCDLCGQSLYAAGISTFYRLVIERHGFEYRALQELLGPERIAHAAAAANVDDIASADVARPTGPATELFVCETCANSAVRTLPISLLSSRARSRAAWRRDGG